MTTMTLPDDLLTFLVSPENEPGKFGGLMVAADLFDALARWPEGVPDELLPRVYPRPLPPGYPICLGPTMQPGEWRVLYPSTEPY